MLSLKNFEKQAASDILERGVKYFRNGHVSDLEEEENGVWSAEVEGSDNYIVEVTLKDNDEIKSYRCDCPYQGFCKHVVAVLYKLQNEIVNVRTRQLKAARKNVFESLLTSITHNDYQNFVREYAKKNKTFKTEFELFFADKDERIDVEKKYTDLIDRLIKKHSTRGFIEYKSSFGLSKEIDKILAIGETYIAKKNYRDAFALSRSVLKCMKETIANCDDSSGNLGESIDNTVDLIEKIASADDVAIVLKEEVFEFLRMELVDKDYFDYGDYGYNLFSIFKDLAVQLNKAAIFQLFTNDQISKLTGKYDDYRREFFKMQLIEFLQETGKISDAESLVQQNMDIVEVRMDVLNKAIANKDYVEAKKLIAEGIKIAESKSHSGTVNEWMKELLRIATLEKDINVVRKYAKYFALSPWSVNNEYYNQWKKTFTTDEWKQTIENHISETIHKITEERKRSKNSIWQPSAYTSILSSLAPIYIQEKYWDRLLKLVQQENNLGTTLQYHQYLIKDYPNELLAIYIPALEDYGINANSRSEYADLVRKMQKIIKDIPNGKNDVLNIAKRLRDRFSIKPRRPAMIEELDILLK